MYFSGMGNDSSLDTYRLTLGQRDDSKCSSLKWTKNQFLLHHHPAMSLEVGLKKTRLILPEDFLVLLLGLGDPGLRWMFSEPGDWEYEFFTIHGRRHFLCNESFKHGFLLRPSFPIPHNVCDQNVSFPDSPRV